MQRKGGYNSVKISRVEFILLLLTAACLAFFAGWFLRGSSGAEPVRITAERTLPPEASPTILPAPSGTAPTARTPVNINTAGIEELQTLPGIGEKRAEDIIAYRKANGPFRIPEDITKVKGIGEGTLENIIDYITTD